MRLSSRIALALIFGLLYTPCAWGFIERSMRQLTVSNGLPSNAVTRIHRTSDGFMWFGTRSGLARYDGSTLSTVGDVGHVSNLMSAPQSPYLWIWAQGKLSLYDARVERIVPLYGSQIISKYKIFGAKVVGDSLVWLSSHTLLIRAKIVSRGEGLGAMLVTQQHYTLPFEDPGERITAMQVDPHSGMLHMATNRDRVLTKTPHDRTIYSQTLTYRRTERHPQAYLHYIDIEPDGSLWVSTNGAGTIHYVPSTGHYVQITDLSNPTVFEVDQIDSTRSIASTWNGYTVIERTEQGYRTTKYSNTFSDTHRSVESRIPTAYVDQDRVLWLGTAGSGVLVSTLADLFFDQWHQDESNAVEGMLFDRRQHLWISAYHGGLMRSRTPIKNKIERKDAFEPLFSATAFSSTPMPYCLSMDPDGNVWAVSKAQNNPPFLRFAHGMRTATTHALEVAGEPNFRGSTAALAFDSVRRTAWIATSSGLLRAGYRTPYQAERIESLSGTNVLDLTIDSSGCVWCATAAGVVRYDPERRQPTVRYLSRFTALSIRTNPNGNIYAGTDGGLAEIDPTPNREHPYGSAVRYGRTHGLSDNYVAVVFEGPSGELWLGTDAGISRFSRSEKVFYNYYIQGNNRSAARSADSTLFWGNNKSIAFFNPQHQNAYYRRVASRPVVFTRLEVDNQVVAPGDTVGGEVVLRQALGLTRRIELGPNNTHFSLWVSNLLFNPAHERYEYRLTPSNSSWVQIDGNERIAFASLAAGTYKLEVRAQTYYPGIERSTAAIEVVVHPMWYNSIWFQALMAILSVVLLGLFVGYTRLRYKRRLHMSQLRAKIESQRAELDKERKVNDERIKFFNYASHELRTPLTLVLSPAQELLGDESLPASVRKKLEMIETNASQLLDQVSRTLARSNSNSLENPNEIRTLNLGLLVRRVVDSFAPLTGLKQIEIRCQGPEDTQVEVDEQKIVSALTNLLTNSIKYRQQGIKTEICVRWSIAVRNDGHFVAIEVSDNGQGIEPEALESIFDPFFTQSSATPAFSSKIGLGLSLVRSIAEAHGGWVEATSRPGEGSTFGIWLPHRQPNLQTDNHTSDHTQQQGTQAEKSDRPTILVVEDNADIVRYLVSLFENDYRVLTASTGEEGLELALAHNHSIDLILHDVVLPGRSGIECCRTLTEDTATAHIPVLLMSGLSTDEKAIEATGVGAVDYIVKPFHPRVLAFKVASILRSRRLLRRMYGNSMDFGAKGGNESNDRFMQRVINTIESSLSTPSFGVEPLAKQLNMSPATLRRKLKQCTSSTANDVIRDVRLTRAATLLMDKNCRVGEVAEAVGYSDVSTFRTQFTRKFGITPSKLHNN